MTEIVIGCDEVGTGAWAGPLAVCAFATPSSSWGMPKLNDSKKLSKEQRRAISDRLRTQCPNLFVIEWGSVEEIEQLGLGKTHHQAVERAIYGLIDRLGVLPDRVIIDGDKQHVLGAEYYPKADEKYPVIMAASILAKVARDELMSEMASRYPEYDFSKNVGYGTAYHLSTLQRIGLCPIHRKSFRPMVDFVKVV